MIHGVVLPMTAATRFVTLQPLHALKARRVLRGGSWNNTPQNLRSANRNRNTPGNRNNNTGFRIASTARGQSVCRASGARRAQGLSRGLGARAVPRARLGCPQGWRRARFLAER